MHDIVVAVRALALLLCSCVLLGTPTVASAARVTGDGSGGAAYASAAAPAAPAVATAGDRPVVPGREARLLADGTAAAPAEAPAAVKQAIWAANEIVDRPYVYGGGHASFAARGYDCSGAVSYALHGAGVLAAPLPSGPLMAWGKRGRGRWISVYANAGHAYAVIAGLRLDTSSAAVSAARWGSRATESGPRWRPARRSPAGYVVRHAPRL